MLPDCNALRASSFLTAPHSKHLARWPAQIEYQFRRQSQNACKVCSSSVNRSEGWRNISREGSPVTGCAIQRRPNPLGLSRLADRDRYQDASSPTLVAQPQSSEDENGATAAEEGRKALETSHTTFVAETKLPTKDGRFRLRGYRHSVDGGDTFSEPCAIMTGLPEGQSDVVVRVHDACFTSEVLGSLKCDCADQLQLAMRYIQDAPPGIIIYLQQEGRGIGLANKIAAYALQESGMDTVDANRALGFPDDCREYTSVHNILKELGVKSIRLMTNNPRKMNVLRALGVVVTDRVPCIIKAQEFSEGYLAVKASRMDHVLDGDFCHWNHDGEPMPPLRSMDVSDSETVVKS